MVAAILAMVGPLTIPSEILLKGRRRYGRCQAREPGEGSQDEDRKPEYVS